MGTGFFSNRRGPFWNSLKWCIDGIRTTIKLPRHFWYFLLNRVIAFIPVYWFRHLAYRFTGIRIGRGSSIKMGAWLEGPHILIGEDSSVGRNCMLDGRGRLTIGNHVSISPDVQLITGSHDLNSPDFSFVSAPIVLEDFVWVGSRATILPGVTVGRGAVVATGAVVTRNVAPMTVVGGVPARKIGIRSSELSYSLNWTPPFC